MVWTLPQPNSRFDSGLTTRLWLYLLEWSAQRNFTGAGRTPRFDAAEAASALAVHRWAVEATLEVFVQSGLIQELSGHGFKLAQDFGDLSCPEHGARARAMFEEHMPPVKASVGEGSGRREWFFIPRRLATVLMRTTRSRGKLATTLGHLVRSLYVRGRGLYHTKHLATADWIAAAFGVAKRTVSSARRWLQEGLGWLRSLGHCWFAIAPDWAAADCGKLKASEPTPCVELATPEPAKSVELAPLHQNLPTESPYQRNSNPGVLSSKGRHRPKPGAPDPRNIQRDDLADFNRTMALFDAMVVLGWLTDSVPERVAFAGSARECLSSARNPAAMLRARVKRGVLAWCSNASEGAIYARVKEFLGFGNRRTTEKPKLQAVGRSELPPLQGDALVMQRTRGRQPLAWSKERFERAQLEFAQWQLLVRRMQAGVGRETEDGWLGNLMTATTPA